MACSRHAESTITGPETLTVICSVMLTHRTSLYTGIFHAVCNYFQLLSFLCFSPFVLLLGLFYY